jgi:hypothetical protein
LKELHPQNISAYNESGKKRKTTYIGGNELRAVAPTKYLSIDSNV